jgi:hypothetical protein
VLLKGQRKKWPRVLKAAPRIKHIRRMVSSVDLNIVALAIAGLFNLKGLFGLWQAHLAWIFCQQSKID